MAENVDSQLKRAADLYRKGDRAGAAKALGRALDTYPGLEQDEAARKLAARITGASPDKAILLLADPDRRDAFVLKVGRGGPQPRASRANLAIWGFGLALVAVIIFTVVYIIANGSFLRLNPGLPNTGSGGQIERRAIAADLTREYHIVLPDGAAPENGWPALVAVHGAGQTGADMAALLGGATQANGILLLAPTLPGLTDGAGEEALREARNTILLMLDDMQVYAVQRPAAMMHLRGQAFFGYGAGARVVTWLAAEGLAYPDAGYTINLPLGIALANPVGDLIPSPDQNRGISYLITAGENAPGAALARRYADDLTGQGFTAALEIVPGGEALGERQIASTVELVRRAYAG